MDPFVTGLAVYGGYVIVKDIASFVRRRREGGSAPIPRDRALTVPQNGGGRQRGSQRASQPQRQEPHFDDGVMDEFRHPVSTIDFEIRGRVTNY